MTVNQRSAVGEGDMRLDLKVTKDTMQKNSSLEFVPQKTILDYIPFLPKK
jgi:hypothetical protein